MLVGWLSLRYRQHQIDRQLTMEIKGEILGEDALGFFKMQKLRIKSLIDDDGDACLGGIGHGRCLPGVFLASA